jgi:tetratricopeptide (TPR) repeat protein
MPFSPPSSQPSLAAEHPSRLPERRVGPARFRVLIRAVAWLAGVPGFAGLACGQPATPDASPAPPPAVRGAPFVFPADDRDLLALDDEMRQYFSTRIDARADLKTQLDQVSAAILGEKGLHLAYDKDGNHPAQQSFRLRRGNCLSFSLLVVAVARAYGLPAEFYEINSYPNWDRSGSFVTEIHHLNVQIRLGATRYEIDPLLEAERGARVARVASAKPVSDTRAFAHFYNNLGVARLAAGAAVEAQTFFDRALAADPTAAFVWANKGTALRLAHAYAAAQSCLERAVKEDPAELAALSSLARLFAETGRPEEAARLEKKVERYRLKDPYYLASLAQAEYARGQHRDANGYLRRAIAIKDDEPEFYELRIRVAQALGWTADAQRWAARVRELRAQRDQAEFAR